MSNYQETQNAFAELIGQNQAWNAISPEYATRMKLQNRFKTGLDIAKHCRCYA